MGKQLLIVESPTKARTIQHYLGKGYDVLASVGAQGLPSEIIVTLGYAGWDAGQLDREITDNVWLTTPALPELIFSDQHAQKAERAAALLGVSLSQLSSFAGHS